MASWAFNNHNLNFRGFDDGNEIMMLSRKSGLDLLHNCDLPPPLKVFSGPEKKKLVPDHDEDDGFRVTRRGSDGVVDDKLELLKALRFSQSRAREAEMKAANLAKERDMLADALLHDSMRLMAHRQWVKLLDMQVTRLKSQWTCPDCGQPEADTDSFGVTCMVALALCLGIAGVGLAFGCTCVS